MRRARRISCFDAFVAVTSIVLLRDSDGALVALLIKLDSKGPVFFRQKRHGFNNEIIRVWKFRFDAPGSREVDRRRGRADHAQTVAPTDPRVTRIGHVLRMTSIDELPQLLNVLAGEMSIVGRGRTPSA